eukprot:comp63285_c0_seq1/m.47947 comp63285_c0_seq1/g.47947  ORF comp63285_c0_seq1/g.47947 comp63285_c0_seq1/m.47947 type:complete len:152 (-) comp63285_c0_seq1:38-493(-)
MASMEDELDELVARQKQIEENLINLEKQIYNFEGSYLEDTQLYGNIFQGFEGFSSSNTGDRKGPRKFKESERLFSLSSATFQKSNDITDYSNKVTVSLKATVGGSAKEDEYKMPKKVIFKQKSGSLKKSLGGVHSLKKKSKQKDTEEELDV